MEEIWKNINDYYQVSNTGKVKRLARVGKVKLCEKIIKQTITPNGYLIVQLNDVATGKQVTKYVHRLVAEAFIPNPHNLTEINHKDENKTNNCVYLNDDGSVDCAKSNLEWCDRKYNCNYGTINKRKKQTAISNGKWKDYSEMTESEVEEYRKNKRREYYKGYYRKHYEANREKMLKHNLKYYYDHKDHLAQKHREYYAKTKEARLAYQKQYHSEHYKCKLNHTVYAYCLKENGEYELLMTFKNITSAASYFGVSDSTIKNVICGKKKKPFMGGIRLTKNMI